MTTLLQYLTYKLFTEISGLEDFYEKKEKEIIETINN